MNAFQATYIKKGNLQNCDFKFKIIFKYIYIFPTQNYRIYFFPVKHHAVKTEKEPKTIINKIYTSNENSEF